MFIILNKYQDGEIDIILVDHEHRVTEIRNISRNDFRKHGIGNVSSISLEFTDIECKMKNSTTS